MRSYYRKCNNDRASCNCAAAVKVADDVLVVDKCGPNRTVNSPLSVKLYLTGSLEPGTQILQFNGGKKYEVIGLFLLK